ncbi:dTMP kinase [Ectothiorhodospiraceae bacterium BW-2]|nr:dTMP kinase [Ectothiorhodospiraceae bacterium BW-2]
MLPTSRSNRGALITLEGGEGAGKSTAIVSIGKILQQAGIAYMTTREPGGTPLGESIRQLLLQPDAVDAQTELLLMFAARRQHWVEKIAPALAEGVWVVSDRFIDASFAYQGAGRGLSWSMISQLVEWTVEGAVPDLTLYLDIDVANGRQRIAQRGALDRFEQEALPFFERVRQGYLQRIRSEPERFISIDASKPLSCVDKTISEELGRWLQSR